MADNGDTELRPLVHALRTPLTIVEGFADALVRRGDDMAPEERAEYIARIAEAAEDMRAILDAVERSR